MTIFAWPGAKSTQADLFFFKNEEIFVQLDKLDELDRITHAWITFNYSIILAQKTF